jgi:uncharacterized OB-fold protein
MNTTASGPTASPSVDFPKPDMSDLGRPFWQALREGALTFQRCQDCHHAWLPARSHCPSCLSPQWQREPACGKAQLISWVVYHVAYHPAFENRLPYTVAVVKLKEGPRMISNVISADPSTLRMDMPLSLVIEEENGVSVPRFEPV